MHIYLFCCSYSEYSGLGIEYFCVTVSTFKEFGDSGDTCLKSEKIQA